MTLLRWMPVPGTTTPDPSPLVHVALHARPSASITAMCVVEPRRAGSARGSRPGRAPRRTRECARPARRPSRRSPIAGVGGAGPRSSRRASRRSACRPPRAGGWSRRRGRGRQFDGPALDRTVGGELGRAQRPAARKASRAHGVRRCHPGRTGRRRRGRGACSASPELGVAQHLALAQQLDRRAPTAPRTPAWRSTASSRISATYAWPAFSTTPSRASRGGRRGELLHADGPPATAASQSPRARRRSRTRPADVEDLLGGPKGHVHAEQLGLRAVVDARRRLHEEIEQRRAQGRRPQPACSHRPPARSAAPRSRTTSASRRRSRRPRCRLPAAPARPPPPSTDAQPQPPPFRYAHCRAIPQSRPSALRHAASSLGSRA